MKNTIDNQTEIWQSGGMMNVETITVWAVRNLVEMSKAQLLNVWVRQERLTYVECIQPKTKHGLIRSILAWQEARGL